MTRQTTKVETIAAIEIVRNHSLEFFIIIKINQFYYLSFIFLLYLKWMNQETFKIFVITLTIK